MKGNAGDWNRMVSNGEGFEWSSGGKEKNPSKLMGGFFSVR